MGYLTNFIVYTLAMVGVMMLALWIFKSSTNVGSRNGAKYLKVIDTMSIGPRKNLYIVVAGEEKFLIAGDADRTSLISKLGERRIPESSSQVNAEISKYDKKPDYIDKSLIGTHFAKNSIYPSVMKNLAEKMREDKYTQTENESFNSVSYTSSKQAKLNNRIEGITSYNTENYVQRDNEGKSFKAYLGGEQ